MRLALYSTLYGYLLWSDMFGFTIKHEMLNKLIPFQFQSDARELFNKSDNKHGGYVTIRLSLPQRVGTDAQNRAFHSLLAEYWLSGLSSYESYEDMRDTFKLRAGGAAEYVYIKDGKVRHAKTLDEVSGRYAEVPKSWTQLSREERARAIDWVIKEATEAGINSKKWDEIIGGMMEEGIK